MPTQPNTHKVVGEVRSDGRVVYVNNAHLVAFSDLLVLRAYGPKA
jgi:hypothetical protein